MMMLFAFIFVSFSKNGSCNKLIVKGIGLESTRVTEFGSPTDQITFYDLDLYPNQFISIDTSKSDDKIYRIEPIQHGKYFNNLFELSNTPMLRRSHDDIKNIGSIKVYEGEGKYRIYYDPYITAKNVVKMYFDCVNKEGRRIAIIQINVMPEMENVPAEEEIFLGDKSYSDLNAMLYVKEVRYGTELRIHCGKTDEGIESYIPVEDRNPVTKVLYNVLTSKSPKSNPKKLDALAINLRDDVIYNMINKDLLCSRGSFYRLELKRFNYHEYPGLTYKSNYIGLHSSKKIFYNIDNSGTLLIDVPKDKMYPSDCLNNFIGLDEELINHKKLFSGSRITNITKSIRILDIERVSRYNIIPVECKYDFNSAPRTLIYTRPTCDFTNPDNLDKDGISCTIFLNYNQYLTKVYKNRDLSLFEDETKLQTFYLDDPESMSLDSNFKPIENKKSPFTVTERTDYIYFRTKKVTEIEFNPIFILLKDKNNKIKHVLRVYHNNDSPPVPYMRIVNGIEGNLTRTTEYNFYEVPMISNKLKFNCSDLGYYKGYKGTIYPKGKNTVYLNVSNTYTHISKLKTAQFEDLFGTSGITILKKPESEHDLEIYLDDHNVTASHIRPIYFICSMRKDQPSVDEKYSIDIAISVDPMYRYVEYHGCGIRNDIFVNWKSEKKNEKNCEFDLNKYENVRFHCPDYVPEHFLEEDQEKYKPDDIETKENPFQSLVRCYDRSSFLSRLFKKKDEVDILKKRSSVSELRSLWEFDESLMKSKGITTVMCMCYDKFGKPKSRIQVYI